MLDFDQKRKGPPLYFIWNRLKKFFFQNYILYYRVKFAEFKNQKIISIWRFKKILNI